MSNLAQIGIDPGISNGCFTILDNGKLRNVKMVEDFPTMMEILKPFGGAPEDTEIRCSIELVYINPYGDKKTTSNMQGLKTNYERLQAALYACNIPFQPISAVAWQSFHNLILPKGVREKGGDYDKLKKNKEDLRHLITHRSIERNTPKDIIWSYEIKHILDTTNSKLEARKMLRDDYIYFSKYDLTEAIKKTEVEIGKNLAQIKNIRKARYHTKANFIYLKSLLGSLDLDYLTALLQIPNLKAYMNGSLFLSKEDMKKLWKHLGVKPLIRREADSTLILLYQLHN